MSSITQARTILAQAEASSRPSPFVSIRVLQAITRFVDMHRWIVFAAVTAICGWGHTITLAARHLDHDELFTFYIAQAPTVGRMLELTRTIDLNPPLSYFLVRSSFAVFGASDWSCRIPFFLAFVACTALIFSFVSRLLSPIYGLMAILILWISPYAHLANDARPYSLVLCFTTLMLVSWYRIIQRDTEDRGWAFATLVAGGFGLLLSHVLGGVVYGSFLGAELIRFGRRRRANWRLWTALLVPLPSVAAYLPLFGLRSELLFSPWSQASPRRVAICYWEHFRYLTGPLLLIVLIAVAWPLLSKRRETDFQAASREEWSSLRWLLFFLFLVPLEIGILFAFTRTAFYERYGVVALISCAIFPVLFLGYRTRYDRRIAGSLALLLAILFVFDSYSKAWLTEQIANLMPPRIAARILYLVAMPPIAPDPLKMPAVPSYLEGELYRSSRLSHLERLDPAVPWVAGTGLTFLELDRYQATAFSERLYLLTNHEAASTLAHNTLFDHYELVKAAFPIRGQVEDYGSFLREHSQFLVLGSYNYPDDWLLRKLEMDCAALSILGTYDDGVIEEHQIYLVRMETAQCGKQP